MALIQIIEVIRTQKIYANIYLIILDTDKIHQRLCKRKVKNGMNDASEKQILFRNGNGKQREIKVTLHIKEQNRKKF